MADPTSDLGEDVTEETAPTCETCGEPIVRDAEHRVLTEIDDGQAIHTHFCSDACLEDWRA